MCFFSFTGFNFFVPAIKTNRFSLNGLVACSVIRRKNFLTWIHYYSFYERKQQTLFFLVFIAKHNDHVRKFCNAGFPQADIFYRISRRLMVSNICYQRVVCGTLSKVRVIRSSDGRSWCGWMMTRGNRKCEVAQAASFMGLCVLCGGGRHEQAQRKQATIT